MNHIDNIKSFNEIGLSPYDNKLWKNGYLKACKQFEKEVEEFKKIFERSKNKNKYIKEIDKIFTHKKVIVEREK